MSLDLKSKVHQINFTLVKPLFGNTYQFEDFRLDAEHLMLYRGNSEVPLPPKQVETLLALIEHHGQIVHKEVLMTRLWGNTAVEESNLMQNIYVLRKVLGKTADGKPMIETLRRRGYRFNGHLKEDLRPANVDPAAEEPTPIGLVPESVPDVATPIALVREPVVDLKPSDVYSPFRKWMVASGVIILLVASVVSGYFLYRPRTALGNKEFAVLPVHPIESGNRSDLYEIGIADSLIQGLSSVNGFVVRPLSATRQYTEIGQDPLAAGREQKVDYVLVSSYQIADGRIKVTSQLLNVASGNIDENFQSESELTSVFAAQEALASSIRSKLMARFARTADRPPAKSGTTNEEAYKYFLQGMVLNDRRIAANALENLDKAVALDPNFARAWAGKAQAHLTAAGTDRAVNIAEEYQRSRQAIDKALALDPDLSEAHSALCGYKFFYEYQFAGAEAECKRAVELDPNSGIAHSIYSAFLSSRGRHDEAIREINAAMDLEPTSYAYQRNYANQLYWARRYDEAVTKNKEILEINNSDVTRYNFLTWCLEMQGKDEEAFEWFMRSLAVQQRDEATIERYNAVYQSSGWRGVLLEREKDPDEFKTNFFRRAMLNAAIGDKDKAFEDLEKAYEQHFWKVIFIQVEPMLDPLRGDPRLEQLVKRIESQ